MYIIKNPNKRIFPIAIRQNTSESGKIIIYFHLICLLNTIPLIIKKSIAISSWAHYKMRGV